MADRIGTSRGFLLFPPAAKAFLRRRATELGGLGLLMLAALLAGALVTYHASDASLDVAARGPVQNALGPLGADLADVMWQSFGLAAAGLVLALAAWAVEIVLHQGFRWRRQALALVGFLLFADVALAAIPHDWVMALPAGLGGAFGIVIWRALVVPATTALPPIRPFLALGLGALALTLLGGALGIGRQGWHRAAAILGRAGHYLARFIAFTTARKAAPAADKPEKRTRVRREPVIESKAPRERQEPELRVAAPKAAPAPRAAREKPAEAQSTLDLQPSGEYQLPPLNLLAAAPPPGRNDKASPESLRQNARLLSTVLEDFGVRGEIRSVKPGPVVTLYELEPAPGTKSSRIIGLSDDIARSMSAVSARVAVIPGRNAIGIELPNADRETVYLSDLLASPQYENTAARLTLALGKDIGGQPIAVDLARMPHLLIAGTTGSGKSVAINTMILSLLYRMPPEQCRFIMIDPKMLELSAYDGIPHLLTPVVTNPSKAVVALKWTVREMEDRYRKMSELGVRNIAGYNLRLAEARRKGEQLSRTVQTGFDPESGEPIFEARPLDLQSLPMIVVIVDEMADLMLVAGKDIEASVQRLSQMARAAGIHLIMATQRPSVDVITGTIKANFPCRISFQVTSKIDSRTILGEPGAEQLLGQGDMLYMPSAGRITRVHAPFVSDQEVEKVVRFLKAQGEPVYVEQVTAEPDDNLPFGNGSGDPADELYDQAVALIARERKASTSFIQRHLQIGYNRAARIIERMEAEGVVSAANHVGKREVLARDIDDRES